MAHLVFINRVYPPEAGATGQLLAELAEHLAARGHRVEVVTASRAESAGVGAEATWRGVTVRRYWSPGLRGRSLGAKAINYLAQYPCLGWQLCRLPTCDVVVSVTDPPLQLVLAALFRRKARGGLIHWAQDVYPEVAEELGVLRRGGWVAQRLRRLAHWAIHRHRALVAVGRCMEERLAQRPGGLEGLVRRVIPNWAPLPEARADEAAAVHFTSDSEREEAESLGVSMRSVVIPLGIEFSPNKEGDDKREPYILYLSRLDPKKNLEGLLKAWALLVPEFPEWKLLVAGEGELGYKQSLQDLTRKLGCAEQVEWLGHIEGEVKTLWLRKAQIFVLPSYSESFGIAAVEAMGAGLACVLGEGVAVGHAASRAEACLLTGTDVLQIKEQLKRVLGNSSLCTQLATKARVFARREYGVETMAERLKQLYEGLIGQCRK